MKMFELVTWFQEEYPELVRDMRDADHHKEESAILHVPEDTSVGITQGGLGFIKYTGVPPETLYSEQRLNPFHLEGDVWTHTMMVCKQAENAPYEVQLAALLHDIGKPSTRAVNPKNGRVSFYNHDAVSAFMSLEIMDRLGLGDEQKRLIFNMIALHTQVYKLSVDQLAAIGDMGLVELLLELGRADHEGRFHSHEGSEIPTFEEVLTAKESPVCRDVDKEVIVLCGLPGAGKSTWEQGRVRKMIDEGKSQQYRVSRDDILLSLYPANSYSESWEVADQKVVDKELQKHFQYAKEYDRVVVDMTHMSKKSRRRSLSHFGKGYKKTCVVFLPTMEEIYLRNQNRVGKDIPREIISKMMKSFYVPTYEEFDEIVWRF